MIVDRRFTSQGSASDTLEEDWGAGEELGGRQADAESLNHQS
jgi:hypothetical protein